MKRIYAIASVLVTASLSQVALGQAADSTAIKVNGATIPAYRVEMAVKSQLAQGQSDTPELRKNIREHLINQEIVAQEAAKKGLEKQPMVAARLELSKQAALADAYVAD